MKPRLFVEKQARHNRHQAAIRNLLRQSGNCPSCGAVMDPNARYLQRPRLVGLRTGQKLFCGQCATDGSYLNRES